LKTFNKLKYPKFVQIYIQVYVYIAETKLGLISSLRY